MTAAQPCAAEDAVTLARTGIVAIENQHFGDALDAFTKAAALRPNDASLCFGAGVAAFMLGRDEVARDRFQCALTRNPDFLPASTWLADLHYRSGQLTDAISVYEALARRSPLSRELGQQLDGWRKELELYSRFRTVSSRHFVAQFEASSDEALARTILERLEKADARIAGMLGVEPSQPITVVLYTREQYAAITRLASWSIAAYDGRIRVPLAAALENAGELDRLLSHELVHAVVATLGGRAVPAWVNEGLATTLEPAGTHLLESTIARTDSRPALSKLHRSFVGLSTDDAQLAYATSAHAMRRLIDERGAPAVVALLKDLAQGEPFDRAFERRLAMRYQDFAALVARD